MRLPQPSAPFSPVCVVGESITVDTAGKVLVLPTGHPYLLPKYNEFTLTEGRALPEAGTYTFTNDFETELGIKNLITPWIALYDPAGRDVDFYLFTYKPSQLSFTVDSEGIITQLILYPGNGLIYYGQITYSNLIDAAYNHDYFDTAYFDTAYFPDSYFSEFKLSNIPKVFDVFSNGSLAQFLKVYGAI